MFPEKPRDATLSRVKRPTTLASPRFFWARKSASRGPGGSAPNSARTCPSAWTTPPCKACLISACAPRSTGGFEPGATDQTREADGVSSESLNAEKAVEPQKNTKTEIQNRHATLP